MQASCLGQGQLISRGLADKSAAQRQLYLQAKLPYVLLVMQLTAEIKCKPTHSR